MGFLPSIIWRALPTEPSVQRAWVLGGVWKVASVSEVSGDWEGAFIVTSESDSESRSWGNSDCFSRPEKSGGSGLLASFHRWVGCGEVPM